MGFDPKLAEQALDELSNVINIFDEFKEVGPSKDLIDMIALFNHRLSALDKQNNTFKAIIKSDLISSDNSILQGVNFEAVMYRIDKTKLDTAKLKTYLGGKLPDFQVSYKENKLDFRPRT